MDELMIQCAQLLLTEGQLTAPRKLNTLELRDTALILTDPSRCVVTLSERNLSLEYLNAEREWYLSGSLNGSDIVKHSKFWEKLLNPDGTINSNYGFFVFHQLCPNGQNQFDWCKQKIQDDPNTRQAVINYNQLMHKYDNNKDFPCTIGQLFRQHNGVIDSTVFMRSNDLIYGTPYDIPWFVSVQQELCTQTGYTLGIFTLITTSLHAYERHFDMIKKIAVAKFPKKMIQYTIELIGDMQYRLKAMQKLQQCIITQQFPLHDASLYGDGSIGWESEIENEKEEFWFYLHTWEQNRAICIIFMKTDGNCYLWSHQEQKNTIQIISLLESAWLIPIDSLQKVCNLYQICVSN